MAPGIQRLGLLIRTGPFTGRSNRAQLDIALAAAAMGIELELFFLNDAVVHLLRERDGTDARLPATPRAWASLAELTQVSAWCDAGSPLPGSQAELSLPVKALERAGMAQRQVRCDLLVVL